MLLMYLLLAEASINGGQQAFQNVIVMRRDTCVISIAVCFSAQRVVHISKAGGIEEVLSLVDVSQLHGMFLLWIVYSNAIEALCWKSLI